MRVGGFGGAAGLAAYLGEGKIDRVVDATHPFASQIARHAREACEQTGIPLATLWRETWLPESGDNWISTADEAGAARALTSLGLSPGSVVFLALGRQRLAAFAPLTELQFLVRMVDAPEAGGLLPLDGCEIVTGRGPFDLTHELSLMRSKSIAALVCRNSGGQGAYAKLLAARALHLPVVMIERPKSPGGKVLRSVEAAANWVLRDLVV